MGRLVVAEVVFSLAVLALQDVPRGHGGWTLAGVAILIALIPLLQLLGERPRAAPGEGARRTVVAALALFALLQVAFALFRAAKPKVIDIGTTTVASLAALMHGANPYALAVDPAAGGILGAAASFHGYKYLPVMLALYAPLAVPLGVRGIVLTNLALQGAAAAALGQIAGRGGGALAGLAAAAIYLSLPFPAYQLFARGANDLVPVLGLLLALLALERRPFWAGVLMGLSLAAKPMPGAAALLCLVPAAGARGRYFAGVIVGLLPILPLALAAPDAFWNNIVLFNALRPIDDTSWLYGLPAAAVIAARALAVAALIALYLRAWRAPAPSGRVGLAAAAILVVFAVGPDMHHNYYLWFIPLFAIVAARAACGAAEETRERAA